MKNVIIVLAVVVILELAVMPASAGERDRWCEWGEEELYTHTRSSIDVPCGCTVNIGDGVTVTLTREHQYATSYIGEFSGGGEGDAVLNLSGSGQLLFEQEMALSMADGTGCTAVLNMSGTSYMNPAALYVGMRSDCFLNITDDAVLEVRPDGTLYTPGILLGNQNYGYALTATLNQSGNSIIQSLGSGMDMGASNTAIYNMSGGQLILGDAIIGPGTDDEFNFSEGTITMAGNHLPWAASRDWFNVLGAPYCERYDPELDETTLCLTPAADLDCDWDVDLDDFAVFAEHWGQSGVGVCQGDFTGDGQVLLDDLAELLSYWLD